MLSMLQHLDPTELGPVFEAIAAGGEPDQARRATLGVIARGSAVPEETHINMVRGYLPNATWPESLVITAVDVDDGSFVCWGVGDRVPLELAAAASCAVPGIFPPMNCRVPSSSNLRMRSMRR